MQPEFWFDIRDDSILSSEFWVPSSNLDQSVSVSELCRLVTRRQNEEITCHRSPDKRSPFHFRTESRSSKVRSRKHIATKRSRQVMELNNKSRDWSSGNSFCHLGTQDPCIMRGRCGDRIVYWKMFPHGPHVTWHWLIKTELHDISLSSLIASSLKKHLVNLVYGS